MLSSPFTANKKWLADKWVQIARDELRQGEAWQSQQWVSLDKLLENFPNYQIFAAMLEYFKFCKREEKYALWVEFARWCFADPKNVPSERLSKILCLRKHFPNDDALVEAKQIVQSHEEAWFPDGNLTSKAKRIDDLIDMYLRKVV